MPFTAISIMQMLRVQSGVLRSFSNGTGLGLMHLTLLVWQLVLPGV